MDGLLFSTQYMPYPVLLVMMQSVMDGEEYQLLTKHLALYLNNETK